MKIETGKGLWVSNSFTERFGNEDIIPANTVPEFRILPRNMYDHEINDELGVEECTLGDVAAFLENPPDGTKDGSWNLFRLPGCVVLVCWFADYRKWNVFDWGLDGGNWHAGYRVFSRNWRSEPEASALSSSDTL